MVLYFFLIYEKRYASYLVYVQFQINTIDLYDMIPYIISDTYFIN